MKPRISATFKSDVVTAARGLFLANGVENTSMDDIAKALKVSKPTVYEHFQSKQLLLDAVFLDATRDVEIKWISDAEASNMPFDEFLREAKRYCIEFTTAPRRVEAYLLVVREGPRSATMREAFLRFLGRPAALNMRRVIKAAIERGECRGTDADVVQRILSAPMYFAMTERAIFGPDAMSADELTRFFEESFRVFADSLCVRAPELDGGQPKGAKPDKIDVADL